MALGLILSTLSKTTDLYNSLSTRKNWHISTGLVNNCWSCNGDHGVKKCKLPKNQARIEANKKKLEEENNKMSGMSLMALALEESNMKGPSLII